LQINGIAFKVFIALLLMMVTLIHFKFSDFYQYVSQAILTSSIFLNDSTGVNLPLTLNNIWGIENINSSASYSFLIPNPLAENLSVRVIMSVTDIIRGLWLVFICWCFFSLLHFNSGRLILLAGCCVSFLMLMPPDLLLQFLLNNIEPMADFGRFLSSNEGCYVAHFFLFFFLSLLSFFLIGKNITVWIVLLSFAGISEVWQFFVLRGPSIEDFFVNTLGIVSAWLVVSCYLFCSECDRCQPRTE